MLSHPAGLGLVLAVINLASPLALTVHLDAAQLGWQQPLLLRGLRLVERGGGSGEGDYSSSDDEEHEPLPAVTQPSTTGSSSSSSSSSSGSGGQSGGRLRGLRRRGAAAAPAADAAQAAAALDAAAAHGNGRRRRTLVSVERISTTRTLWQLLRGGGAGEWAAGCSAKLGRSAAAVLSPDAVDHCAGCLRQPSALHALPDPALSVPAMPTQLQWTVWLPSHRSTAP